jgi:hypothetical protein
MASKNDRTKRIRISGDRHVQCSLYTGVFRENEGALIKEKIKFSLYIRKFRRSGYKVIYD